MKLRVIVGALTALAIAVILGIPTGIIETPFYTRMTPVLWWNYPVWATSSALTGALAATYVRQPAEMTQMTQGGKTFLGNMLSLFAIGCPICNKLVVMSLGVSGALTWFAPAQPFLAVGSLALLGYALWQRVQRARACRVSVPHHPVNREGHIEAEPTPR
ncbi:hypothetical protein GCM10027062_09180 [Nocardioides hungaricus]